MILSLAEVAMIVAPLRRPPSTKLGFRGSEAILALAWGSIGAVIAVRKTWEPDRLAVPDHFWSPSASAKSILDGHPLPTADQAQPQH